MVEESRRGPFCLVLMTENNGEKSVSAIPSTWISPDGNSCVWPNNKGAAALLRARGDFNSPVEKGWPSFPCVIKKQNIMTLKEGRQIEAAYEGLSDTEAEQR